MICPLDSFRSWQRTARAGQRYEYFTGRLGVAACEIADVRELQRAVVSAYLSGHYELAQARVGQTDRFAYYIIKRLTHDPDRRFWIRNPATEILSPRRDRNGAWRASLAQFGRPAA